MVSKGCTVTRVQIDRVSKSFAGHGKKAAEVFAVNDVSIDIASGEIHAVIGYSGAGKSTLLRLINGLERATSGEITIGDTLITGFSEKQLREVRGGIGMIFQQFNLLQSRTAQANVEYPLEIAGIAKDERQRRAAELLDFVGLKGKEQAYPEQLSGGQRQRVGIARALATKPGVLLADEATSALDPETSAEVLSLLKEVNREFGITIILITHEMEVVRQIADRVTVMEEGRVVEQGDTYQVFSNPQQNTTRRFVETALPNVPAPEVLEAIKRRGRGTLVTISFTDEGEVDQPVIITTLTKHGVTGSIEGGGVTQVSGRVYGQVTMEIIGDEAKVRAAIAELSQHTTIEEL
nr:ATP-binding cassette domain-containing protein [Leucobacter chinensis]